MYISACALSDVCKSSAYFFMSENLTRRLVSIWLVWADIRVRFNTHTDNASNKTEFVFPRCVWDKYLIVRYVYNDDVYRLWTSHVIIPFTESALLVLWTGDRVYFYSIDL
jgi:hypothetical protein